MDEGRDGELPDRLCGMRTVRLLATGERSRVVLLQHPSGIVAKLFHSGVDRAEIDRELAAMARIDHPHVVRLLDAETLPDGRVVVLAPRLENGSVTRFLERRGSVSLGEAITLVAPLVDAVGSLHAAGVAHTRIGAPRILLDASGAPVLVGMGSSVLLPPAVPALRAAEPSVIADRLALRGLMDRILSAVDGAAAAEAERARRTLGDPSPDGPERAVQQLFAVTSGSPLVLTAPARPEPDPVLARTRPRPSTLHPVAEDIAERGPARMLRDAAGRIWGRIPAARRRVVVAACAAVGTAAFAVALVPTGEADGAGTDAPSSTTSRTASNRPVGRRTAPTRSASGPHASSSPTPSDAISTPETDAIAADDPLAAARLLLGVRERCLREQDGPCLAGIDEAGSAVRADDQRVVESGGEAMTPDGPVLRVVDRLGDAALLTDGATEVLLVRTEDGWRIREVNADDPD